MNDPMDVAFVSPMQQPLDMLVDLCSTEGDTQPLKMPDDCHGTERILLLSQRKEKVVDWCMIYGIKEIGKLQHTYRHRTPIP